VQNAKNHKTNRKNKNNNKRQNFLLKVGVVELHWLKH